MDLTLTYEEAIDFIINLDLSNLLHDNRKAYIHEARKILCCYLAEGKTDSEKVITFSPKENYKFEPVERDCSFWIEKHGSPFPRPAEELIEKEKYSSDGIRAFMENESLIERINPAAASDKKQPENKSEGENAFFRGIGRKGGKARTRSELLKRYIEDFANKNQSATFEEAWRIWKNKKTITFNNTEINFTDTAVEIDGKTLKKPSVSRYFYDAKKDLQ